MILLMYLTSVGQEWTGCSHPGLGLVKLEYATESEYNTLPMEDPNCPRLVPLEELLVTPPPEESPPASEEIRDGEFVYSVHSYA